MFPEEQEGGGPLADGQKDLKLQSVLQPSSIVFDPLAG
jgi:hypothetical protein